MVLAWWIKMVKCTFVRLSYNIMPVNGIILSTPKTIMYFCANQEMKSLLRDTWAPGFPGLHAAGKSRPHQAWVRGPCVATCSSPPSGVTAGEHSSRIISEVKAGMEKKRKNEVRECGTTDKNNVQMGEPNEYLVSELPFWSGECWGFSESGKAPSRVPARAQAGGSVSWWF